MGSSFILTIANYSVFLLQRDVVRQMCNSIELGLQYIGDIPLATNWPTHHFFK